MSNLLAQHKEIRRLEKEEEKRKLEEAEEEERKEQEAAARALEDFEKVQMGLTVKLGGDAQKGRKVVGREGGKIVVEETEDEPSGGAADGDTATRGKKRKFELDEAELLRIANEDRDRAKKTIAQEKAEASKTQLPSFWISSLTPSTKPRKRSAKLDYLLNKKRIDPTCPASSKESPHALSLKTMVTVNFTEEKDDRTGEVLRVCPSCKKGLGGGMKIMCTSSDTKLDLRFPCLPNFKHALCGSDMSNLCYLSSPFSDSAPSLPFNLNFLTA